MADNLQLDAGAGGALALTYEVSFSGDTAHLQGVTLFALSGSEGSYTVTNVIDATNGVLVNLGTNNDITVTGTVDLGAVDNAVLDAIAAANVATQAAVEGTLTVGLPSGAATDAVLITIDAVLDVINAKLVTGTVIGDVNIAAVTPDLALGTDISSVFGTASLILATQADNVVNTVDGLQTSSFGYMFDGSTWDRMRGDALNGVLVNLGGNNDVTISQTVTVALDATNNAVLDAIAASTAATNVDTTAILADTAAMDTNLATICIH